MLMCIQELILLPADCLSPIREKGGGYTTEWKKFLTKRKIRKISGVVLVLEKEYNQVYKFEIGGVGTLNIDDIIEYDEESTNLDFKKEEYHKSDYASLIKDISSMANALNSETKRIVIGIKHRPGEDKEFIGIEKLTDQATLENVIQENIEPNINFKYYSH